MKKISNNEKNENKAEHEMRRETRNFQRGNTKVQRKELAENLSAQACKKFAAVTNDILKDDFAEICDIKLTERRGFFKICMNKKGVPEKSVPQIEITITKDFKFNIHLNDYENYEDYYFYGEKLTTQELVAETKNFKEFLNGKTDLENSKLEKISYEDQQA